MRNLATFLLLLLLAVAGGPVKCAWLRDELGKLIEELEETCVKFEEAKERKLDRDAKLAEKRAAKAALAGAAT